MTSPVIIYGSTSGHTEYVVDTLVAALAEKGVKAVKMRAEKAEAKDLEAEGPLVLASSTWNTGNAEGQLNPHMFALLLDRAKGAALNGRPVACIALGDERYRYRANAAVYMEAFVKGHGGTELCPTLKILNEPFGQEKAVQAWADDLYRKLQALSTKH